MKTGLRELANKALYEEYRRRLDPRAILEHYSAQNCSELGGSEGTTEIVHSCLLDRVEPHHSNGDQSPSACLNIDKKLYVCYSNGWAGDLFHLVAKLEGKETLADALPVIGQFLTGTVSESDDLCARLEQLFARPDAALLDPPTYHERILDAWRGVHPYLYERGITDEAAAALRLGYDDRENRIVFPHFWDGKLVGWQKRTIPARAQWPGTWPDYPKYRNCSGMPKSETLYHYDAARAYTSAIIVESPMSVAKAVSLGLDNVVATFGAKVSEHQIAQMRDFKTVYVWFDSDPSGRAGERKIVEGLYRHVDVQVVLPEQDKDLGDYDTLDEVLGMLSTAVPAALRRAQYPRKR
ncbi:DNA primase [Mycobacterium phage Phrappuccino]|uniref:DNA primase n=1 Tax=Mycobacterium phage Phrappuccino TaxID=2591223 RepID=A0A514DDV4_9CAUD|nr:helicase [Mycobacterium phage Phrappuccino]QDH91790.1 DNA primase [Mycobacterium phage Phrappuccino]QIQ63232.1 DNA primase [Mycobacterium phage Settecandela]